MRKNIILLLVLCILLSGCATLKEISETRKNLAKIEVGMSEADIFDIMGSPYRKEIFILENGDKVEFYRYITEYTGGTVDKSDTIPICLQNGKVIGWGRKFCRNKKRGAKVIFP